MKNNLPGIRFFRYLGGWRSGTVHPGSDGPEITAEDARAAAEPMRMVRVWRDQLAALAVKLKAFPNGECNLLRRPRWFVGARQNRWPNSGEKPPGRSFRDILARAVGAQYVELLIRRGGMPVFEMDAADSAFSTSRRRRQNIVTRKKEKKELGADLKTLRGTRSSKWVRSALLMQDVRPLLRTLQVFGFHLAILRHPAKQPFSLQGHCPN